MNNKTCLDCGIVLDRKGSFCLVCADKRRKESVKKHYENNKESILKKSKKREIKYKTKCPDCGKLIYRDSTYCKKCVTKYRPPSKKKTEKEKEKFRGINSGKSWKGGISRRYGRRVGNEHLSPFCSVCEKKQNLDIHHIDKDERNNKKSNLIRLCRSCHKKVHSGNLKIKKGIAV